MALNDLILRSESHSPLTTKGSELTYAELDGNFIELYDYLSAMNSGSGIAPYDNSTTYSGTEYVSYNGNIYVHISATSTTGVLPDSDATKWQLTSIGALAHQQNKDTYLAQGSATEVSATDLYSILNEQTINITLANFLTAQSGGLLKVNRLYCITNTNSFLDTGAYVNSQVKLYIRTISNSKYSLKGFISFVAPTYSGYDIYDYTYAYLVGDKVGYGLLVYECTSATTNGDTPNNDTSHWAIKSYLSFPAYYTTKFYDVDFNLESGLINVLKVYDNFNNTFGIDDFLNANIVVTSSVMNNTFDTNSKFNGIYSIVGGVMNNTLVNSYIGCKGGYVGITLGNNTLNKSTIVCDNFILGNISGCNLNNVQLVLLNDFQGTIQNIKASFNAPTGFNIADTTNINDGYINEQGSNIYAEVDITGAGGVIDLDTILGSADIYGEFRFDCVTEMIDYLIKANYYCPIKVMPNSPHNNITLKIYSLASATDNQMVSTDYSGNIDLYTDNGDYAILERVIINGVTLWNVTYINKVA